ncbi:MAG: DUF89 family protein [Planctomycetes bacterium]|nr:DUF89 family protein [Planctomycetota bacterium]
MEFAAETTLTALPLIADLDTYRADTLDMERDADTREFWLRVFEHNTPSYTQRAISSDARPDAAQRGAAFSAGFLTHLQTIRRDPKAIGYLSIVSLCALRRRYLLQYDFADPYLALKQQENEAALRLLPALLAELDDMPADKRLLTLVTGIFAGNIFDMGCASTIALYENGETDFHAVRARIKPRPWRVDDFDAFAGAFSRGYRKTVMFVDNSGADIVLGMIPFARHILQSGSDLVMTANTHPALNDITHTELVDLIARVARIDATFADALDAGQLTLVPSGNDLPVIDMTRVSPELAEASRDADLLIIEGMGRSLETNYFMRFACDTLKVAMIKEEDVAKIFDGGLYDVVCRFEPADGD